MPGTNASFVLRTIRHKRALIQGLKPRATTVGPPGRVPMVPWTIRVFAALLLYLAACNKPASAIVDELAPPSDGTIPQRIEYSDWSLVLSRIVRGNEIDLEKLMLDPAPLDAFLAQAAAVGRHRTPELIPDETTELALLVNLHNAVVVKDLLMFEQARAAGAGHRRALPRVQYDGRGWTLADLRHEILRLSHDDWRIPFALFDGRRDGPPLWPKPILPDGLDDQLTRITQSALKQPQIVSIDHARQRLLLWPGLHEMRRRLITQYERKYHTTHGTVLSVLLDLADADRRAELNTAIGYTVGMLPPNSMAAVVNKSTVLK